MRRLVYVMAKAPVPGRVKTRLCPPLEPRQAAELAAAFVEDLLASLAGAGDFDVRLALEEDSRASDAGRDGDPGDEGQIGTADAAREAALRLRRLAAASSVRVEGQGEGDLGRRMSLLVDRGLAEGWATVLVGGDVPDLPLATVRAAFEALERTDVVLAASRDGGYVLVGARRRHDALFSIDAAWSSPDVFSATCTSLAKARCSYATLPAWEDVDDAPALGRLAGRLDGGGDAVAPATARLMRRWRREGVRF
ncbi:MAG TPA: TIGR04282 family arsenosugar biosynthesis glycosyltransferase [Candidatus Limnocylindrales bacterium]|nr:TIGR04282 family arsenosugar biosynthesis glycosyltransferase [Candidatus Limnocylindrales bacterium]